MAICAVLILLPCHQLPSMEAFVNCSFSFNKCNKAVAFAKRINGLKCNAFYVSLFTHNNLLLVDTKCCAKFFLPSTLFMLIRGYSDVSIIRWPIRLSANYQGIRWPKWKPQYVQGKSRQASCVPPKALTLPSNAFHILLFIYLRTANDGRPRPKEVIGNAKVNKNRDARRPVAMGGNLGALPPKISFVPPKILLHSEKFVLSI